MQSLMNLLSFLFSNKKTLVYITLKRKDYAEVTKKLKTAGVRFRVATLTQTTSGKEGTTYKIYVKKQAEHKALQAMYHG